MTIGRTVAVAAVLALTPLTASPQSVAENIWHDAKWGFLDAVHIWTAPFHGSRSDWLTFGAFTAGVGAISLLDDDVDSWIVRNEGTLGDATKAFRDPPLVHFGSAHRSMWVVAALWGTGIVLEQRDLRDAGMGCMAGIQANSIVRSVAYKTVSRPRPLVAGGDQYQIDVPGGDWDYHSFPGGHGANAFACAAFLAERFDLRGWGEALLYGAATGVSVGRMVDRRHWLSDAVIGAVLGYSMGRTIAARSRHRAARSTDEENGSRGDLGGFELSATGPAVVIAYRLRF